MSTTATETTKTKYSIHSKEHLFLDDDLIVFSAKHQQYFGINGAGRLVWMTLNHATEPISETDIIATTLSGRDASDESRALILEAIRILVDLGVLDEQ